MKNKFITLCMLSLIGAVSYGGYLDLTKESKKSTVSQSADKHIAIQMSQYNVSTDKEWVVTFDHGINQKFLNEKSVYIQDQDNKQIPVSLQASDSRTLVVKAPDGGYQKGRTYDLYIDRDLDSGHTGDKTFPKQYRIQFSTM